MSTKAVRFTTLLSLFVLLMPALLTSQAVAQADDLYRAEVPVQDRSELSRNEALDRALAKVLVKASGSRQIEQAEGAEVLLSKASRYLRQYRYLEKVVPADIAANTPRNQLDVTADGTSQKQLFLRVDFNADALLNAMNKAGLSIWSQQRPAVMLWLAVRQGRERYILSNAEEESALSQAVLTAAAERGLPVILPLMDLDDRRSIEYADIQGGFSERVVAATERYGAEVVLQGQLEADRRGRWRAKWKVYGAQQANNWQDEGLGVHEMLRSGIDGVSDMLAARYAISAGAGDTLYEYIVSVNNVRSLDDYARVLNYMAEQIQVEAVTPVRIENNIVNYRLLMRGEGRDLEKVLAISGMLRRVADGQWQLPSLRIKTITDEPSGRVTNRANINAPQGPESDAALEIAPLATAASISVRDRIDYYYSYQR